MTPIDTVDLKIRTRKVALIKIRFYTCYLYQMYKVVGGILKPLDLPHLSETLQENEGFLPAAIRGLKEELDLYIPPSRLKFLNRYEETKLSITLNIPTKYIFELYQLNLDRDEFYYTSLIVEEDDGLVILGWK